MRPPQAFDMGWQSASAGYFFDGMEIIAALAPSLGGLDPLHGAIALLFPERDRVNTSMDQLAALCSSAFREPWPPPRSVDDYRHLLRNGVFEIVNRWSFIQDIHTVNRLQAWFYAGFGLGRAETVARGLVLRERLVEIAGDTPPLPDMPENLRRMALEGARQMDTAAREDDLAAVRPLFLACAQALEELAEIAAVPAGRPGAAARIGEALDLFTDTARKVQLDLARSDVPRPG